jgi:hypothetical protein
MRRRTSSKSETGCTRQPYLLLPREDQLSRTRQHSWPTQLADTLGIHSLAHLAAEANRAFSIDLINRQVVHFTDVQKYLAEELNSAYTMLSLPKLEHLWQIQSNGGLSLHEAVRQGNTELIQEYQEQFFATLGYGASHSTRGLLAWAVLVESVLLNERMIEDMNATTDNQGFSLAPHCWMPFYGPNPSEEARQRFVAYAKARWPIKVFTVDPVNNEQNIADVSTIYREMQLAIAMSVAANEIGVNAAMNTLRKIQRDTATIELNRTIVGFAHADDTFGWRFYPRFQTPPVEGSLKVFFRDLVAGGPTDKQLLRSKQIEPGMRECVAIVLMPSFVPKVEFDSRGNWFRLDRPGHTAMSMKENLQHSRAVEAMRTNSQRCIRCTQFYRPGEVDRLLKRIEQLDRELPTQTLVCQVPIENTSGGFEILASGSRELAPELLGWYGAPGYDPEVGAAIFLVGDNFSVHRTSIIAGNQSIPIERMLSRNVIQITLPPSLPVIFDERIQAVPPSDYAGYLDVHLATAYGVSGHLLVPVVKHDEQDKAPFLFEPSFIQMVGNSQLIDDETGGNERFKIDPFGYSFEPRIVIKLPKLNSLPDSANASITLTRQTPAGAEEVKLDKPLILSGKIENSKLVIEGPALEPLVMKLMQIEEEQMKRDNVGSSRQLYILTTRLNAKNVLNDEPVVGGIPIQMIITPK